MRTRNQTKQQLQSTGEQGAQGAHDSIDDNETLSNISRDAVGKLLKRVKRGFNKEDVGYLRHCESGVTGSKGNAEDSVGTVGGKVTRDVDSSVDLGNHASMELNAEAALSQHSNPECHDDDSYWEDGSVPASSSIKDHGEELINGVSVEFDISPGLAKRKPVRRATAEEKEVAELVHKAHLLCLLGRGRLIDDACNDPLIQASLLSLLPTHLHKISELPKLTARDLSPLVSWFCKNFHVKSSNVAEQSCHSALASTLETQEGTPEAVVALSVAMFRALNLTARFVSILDVVSLKPEADDEVACKGPRDVFSMPTLMVAGPGSCSFNLKSPSEVDCCGSPKTAIRSADNHKPQRSRMHDFHSHDSRTNDKPSDEISDATGSGSLTVPCSMKSDGRKRKGDVEFQMQMEMALAATAIESSKNSVEPNLVESPSSSSALITPSKRTKKIRTAESQTSPSGLSIAIGSKKIGAPLYWAEVFCNGENLTGKWVHVDAVNAFFDGEDKVESAAAACKKSLRYVVAFGGHGAKDVTRRYCTKWYKIAPQRINSNWWDSVLAPLKELESVATSGAVELEQEASGGKMIEKSQSANLHQGFPLDADCSPGSSREFDVKKPLDSSRKNAFAATRGSLEDMELETRALTEPLPTNQQAYRNHHLYVIERWLKKYEILYPKGPVLGFCSGHAVYPRSCVRTLHTKERWLHEGLQVKADELPAKVVKRSLKHGRGEAEEDDEYSAENHSGTILLYGKWQTQPLCLPRAVNGIVPKNERGQVDVWSEKCLPPGTAHLPLPRVALVAKRLDIDYAPAMVGFEHKNGRSYPLFNGIVVCSEFKDAVLEAYAEEEERRVAEEKKRNEAQALQRWYQLLSSIITRQRLNDCYGEGNASRISTDIPKSNGSSSKSDADAKKMKATTTGCRQVKTPKRRCDVAPVIVPTENHEHEFVFEEQASDEESSTRVKRCHCGFSIQFEEL